ncbi:hypothetical protein [Streptomyces sp. NPDC004250]|uniref:hypothetical protein n=1 Tax=Streptomyces sp. NPDC004250 TaxID=3364692 RepID=UPI0036C5426B
MPAERIVRRSPELAHRPERAARRRGLLPLLAAFTVPDDNPRALSTSVRVAAAFTLAPTATWAIKPVTRISFAVMWVTCHAVSTGSHFEGNPANTRFPAFKYTLASGNRDFYNRQWSSYSGQVASRAGAMPRSTTGSCLWQYEGSSQPQVDQPCMTAAYQRLVTGNRVLVFQRFLHGSEDLTPCFTGARSFPGGGRPERVAVDHVPGTGAQR